MELAGSPGSSLPALVLTLDSGVICNGERTPRRSFPSVSVRNPTRNGLGLFDMGL
jgi:hypothetical protein